MKQNTQLEQLIRKIIWIGISEPFLSSTLHPKKGIPGAVIKALSNKERELLKSATTKDFNHRVDMAIEPYEDKPCYDFHL